MIGDLREQVTLQEPVRTGDGAGGASVAWTTVATVWAAIETVSGASGLRAERLRAEATHRITIRHRTDLDETHRLLWGTRILRIEAMADPDGRRRWLTLTCEEERT